MKKWKLMAALAVATLLSACGGGGGGGSDSTASTSTTGSLSVAVTDAPVDDVSRVQITFDAIGIKPHNGTLQKITLAKPEVIDDLTKLTDGNASAPILDGHKVPAGQYDYIRLYIVPNAPDSFVDETNGARQNLVVPGQQGQSQADRFVQLSSGFTVPAGGTADFTIDFQLRKALVKPPGQNGDYFLRPSLRLINNVKAGTIHGTVANTLVQDPSCDNDLAADGGKGKGNAVYLYADSPSTLGDIYIDNQGQPVNPKTSPIVTADVKQNTNTGAYEYTIGFVQAGTYTVAFTCQALDDQPEAADSIKLVQPQSVTVQANKTATVNFPAS